MIGLDEKNVYVHDNSKQDVQCIPFDDLQQAWANDYIGISKKNAFFGIDMQHPNRDISTIIQRGLEQNANLYLNSPISLIGRRSLERLIKEIPTWGETFSPEVLEKIWLHIIEFSGSTIPELPKEISGFSSGVINPHQGGRDKLAAALQQKKKRVLAIDMDGQANLTESFGLSIEEEQTVYGAMRGEYPLPVIKAENGISIVPACLDLSAAESELINEPGRELILKGLIARLLETCKFDYILIDCPPSLGLLTLNALTAADYLIIPVQAQFLAMRGMAKITNVIEIVRERLNPNLNIGGIVITQFDKRKTLNKNVSEIINDSFCDKVFKTVIRDNVALAEAPIKGKNIFEYNKNSNGAKDYMSLAQEVLKLK